MKTVVSIVLLSIATLLSCSCVSRTTTTKDGYGQDQTEKNIVWIWQKGFRESK